MSKPGANPVKERLGRGTLVDIEGKRLRLTNLDKVLYPEAGFTKGQVINYYARIGPIILKHLADRPLTLKRYPGGVDQDFFYEKECPSHRPEWFPTLRVPSERAAGFVNFCVVNDLPSLIWVANLASLEMHVSLSRTADVLRPTMMVFDLDPGPPAGLLECLDIAFRLRDLLTDVGLASFAKTSGGKGLHLYVPLNTPTDYDHTKNLARSLAELLQQRYPNLVTSNMRKDLRPGKVFVDWSQNDDHKTTVCVYSLRARPRPTVSAPVSWDELTIARRRKNVKPLILDAEQVLGRVMREGDMFEPVLTLRQRLPEFADK